jgi:hypothetical protein
MVKLKFTIKGIEFEYEGEPLEVQTFFQRLMNGQQIPMDKLSPHEAPLTQDKPSKRKIVDITLKPDTKIKEYIISKPNYKHTLFEIQEQFYGTKFKSRGETGRMYHKTSKQLKRVRKEIETEQKGKFQEVLGEDGTKRFTFEKSQQVTLVA